ncbi:MAG: hypothetical protein IMY72_11760 [Bacteroidetes bacterium]|nr:hypothetical protein [Bacteroidota bacterium]
MVKTNYIKKIASLEKALKEANTKLKNAANEQEKADAGKAIDNITKQLLELNKEKEESEKQKFLKSDKKFVRAMRELSMMDKYNVDELFVNSKGAYFLTKNLADLSEDGKNKGKKITRENLIIITNRYE